MAQYPAEWEFDVVLTDGGTLHVRPIDPGDAERLVEFHRRLSQDTIYYRFFSPRPVLPPRDVERFTRVDYEDRMALVGVLGEQIVAVARYDRVPGTDEAEVAFVVEDTHQGRGIGTVLLEHLAGAARQRGIHSFVAETLPDNRRMIGVFRDAGWEVHSGFADGVVQVSFSIEPTPESLAAMEERERKAEAMSVARLLEPSSIAVIGASRRPGTIGHELFLNLLAGHFAGPVYPVNPGAAHVASVRAYPTVEDVPDDVDLAVIVVPASEVAEAVRGCARKRVRGLVVISAGFSELGTPEGVAAEREIVELARRNGMRMIGPNGMGVVNAAAGVSMNATFSPHAPPPGPVAFLSQSGALGIALLEWAGRLKLGVSQFVSVGNKADVSGNDLLQYWEHDEHTRVILMYLESFGNPRKFSRIARRVARRKPIVAVKSGRSAAGTRAAQSHTAAAASPDTAVDALFLQTGVIRVDTLGQLFDVAQLLAYQPLPRGRSVAIVGNSGGPGILAADACEAAGLLVPELAPATRDALRSFLPAGAAVRNPVDLVAGAQAGDYERALQAVLADPGVDAVIAIFTPTMVTEPDDVAEAIVRAAAATGGKPVLANFLAVDRLPPAARPDPTADGAPSGLPVYGSPETAAQALAKAAQYAEWQTRDEGVVPALAGVDEDAGRAIVEKTLAEHPEGTWLHADEAAALLRAYSIPVADVERAGSADEAAAAADHLGYPVVLKAASPDLVHKTDVGGVRLGLESADAVRAAFRTMAGALGGRMGGAIVQPMATPGTETIVGVVQDPSFGPLVMFGLGGVATELLGDRAFRILPLTDVDAADLVRSIRGAPLLLGYRGAPPADVPALEALLLRVGRLADDVPELAELDLNPVIVSTEGALAVDVKLRLTPPPPRPEYSRRLRAPR